MSAPRTTERQAMIAAWRAVHAMGGILYTTHSGVMQYYAQVKDGPMGGSLVNDYHTACELRAFIVERPFYGNNQHGWRLNRLHPSTAQSEIGRMFFTAGDFADAMRTAEDMADELTPAAPFQGGEQAVIVWEKAFDWPPIGTKVLVLRDNGTILETETRSDRWETHNGDVLISVKGITDGYSFDRIYVKRGG